MPRVIHCSIPVIVIRQLTIISIAYIAPKKIFLSSSAHQAPIGAPAELIPVSQPLYKKHPHFFMSFQIQAIAVQVNKNCFAKKALIATEGGRKKLSSGAGMRGSKRHEGQRLLRKAPHNMGINLFYPEYRPRTFMLIVSKFILQLLLILNTYKLKNQVCQDLKKISIYAPKKISFYF